MRYTGTYRCMFMLGVLLIQDDTSLHKIAQISNKGREKNCHYAKATQLSSVETWARLSSTWVRTLAESFQLAYCSSPARTGASSSFAQQGMCGGFCGCSLTLHTDFSATTGGYTARSSWMSVFVHNTCMIFPHSVSEVELGSV